jgi:hypothetical protein
MDHYLRVKFPLGNNEQQFGHSILITNEGPVVPIEKETGRRD